MPTYPCKPAKFFAFYARHRLVYHHVSLDHVIKSNQVAAIRIHLQAVSKALPMQRKYFESKMG